MLKRKCSKLRFLFVLVLLTAIVLPAHNVPASSARTPQTTQCVPQAGMLKICFRPTPRFMDEPSVLSALLRAASRWESIIQTPITIVIDVDYGPTNFGEESLGDSVLARTDEQPRVISGVGYQQVRAALISKATGAQEMALANALPTTGVMSDVVPVAGIVAPTANLRALGLLNPVADIEGEKERLGNPPRIAFNSTIKWDLDPSNGIDSDRADFDATATHEIGHVLGFLASIFFREDGSFPNFMFITVLDLFRFAPGVTMETFPTARRKLKAGGAHVFFDGIGEIPFSTANFENKGGDGFEGSHWKEMPPGNAIGIMDARLDPGERNVITSADIRALDVIGYTFKEPPGPTASLDPITGSLAGDAVTLTGTVTDAGNEITMAQTTLLDEAGNIVRQDAPVAFRLERPTIFNSDAQVTISFTLQVKGLTDFPTAFKCRLVLIDSLGRQSNAQIADFSQADSGGPTIKSTSFNGSKITVKSNGLNGQIQLEINGVIVGTKNQGGEKKLKIKGNQTALNLKPGANRVRVRENNLWSNIMLLANGT